MKILIKRNFAIDIIMINFPLYSRYSNILYSNILFILKLERNISTVL